MSNASPATHHAPGHGSPALQMPLRVPMVEIRVSQACTGAGRAVLRGRPLFRGAGGHGYDPSAHSKPLTGPFAAPGLPVPGRNNPCLGPGVLTLVQTLNPRSGTRRPRGCIFCPHPMHTGWPAPPLLVLNLRLSGQRHFHPSRAVSFIGLNPGAIYRVASALPAVTAPDTMAKRMARATALPSRLPQYS
jgi:hypothetical protein